MATPITFEQFRKKLSLLSSQVKKIDIALVVAKDIEGSMKIRIFNEGQATDGTTLGRYRSNWKNVRKKHGRQVAYKDLEFEGALRRSIVTGQSKKNEAVCAFDREKSRLIASGQQEQTGKEIFEPSKEEVDEAYNKAAKLMERNINQVINRLF